MQASSGAQSAREFERLVATVVTGCITDGVLAAMHDDYAERTKQCHTLWQALIAVTDATSSAADGAACLDVVSTVRARPTRGSLPARFGRYKLQ